MKVFRLICACLSFVCLLAFAGCSVVGHSPTSEIRSDEAGGPPAITFIGVGDSYATVEEKLGPSAVSIAGGALVIKTYPVTPQVTISIDYHNDVVQAISLVVTEAR